MLVSEVTVSRVDVPRPMTRVQVLWCTGAVSDFTIDRKTRFDARATPERAIAFIEQSFATKSDQWIADQLNDRCLRTGAGLPWTLEGVRRVRLQHQWFRRTRKRREATVPDSAQLYSAHAIAAQLGVKTPTVLDWVRRGILTPTERGSPGHPYRFRLDEAVLERLRAKKHEMDQRRAAVHGAAGQPSSR